MHQGVSIHGLSNLFKWNCGYMYFAHKPSSRYLSECTTILSACTISIAFSSVCIDEYILILWVSTAFKTFQQMTVTVISS